MDYPYTPGARLGEFLKHIQKAGVPAKVTRGYLGSVGFKSSNDRYMISVLKMLGFLDSSGVPTARWKAYRDRDEAGAVLAMAIKETYSDLFSIYPDAHRKDDEALRNFFSTRTDLAQSTVGLMIRTFRTLAEAADFEAKAPGVTEQTAERIRPAGAIAPSGGAPSAPPVPTVALSLQITLPATDDPKVYDSFFAAMKKHLFPEK